jgi:hypothetical protein
VLSKPCKRAAFIVPYTCVFVFYSC